MALTIVNIDSDSQVLFSLYTGINLYSDENYQLDVDKLEELDKTCLFYFFGDVNEYGYINPKLNELVGFDIIEAELTPEQLCKILTVNGGMAYCHDAGWSGLYWIGFGLLT